MCVFFYESMYINNSTKMLQNVILNRVCVCVWGGGGGRGARGWTLKTLRLRDILGHIVKMI